MKTILLVDDEFPARKLLKAMLKETALEFSVAYEARDGAEALEVYKRHKPDLIISDIQMPVMDGLALLSAIRGQNPKQPFVILSCYERFDYARQVIRLGALDYLIKDTLTADVLYTVLQNAADVIEGHENPKPAAAPEKDAPPCAVSMALQMWRRDGDAAQAAERIGRLLGKRAAHYFMVSVELEHSADPELLLQALEALPQFCKHCGCCWLSDSNMLIFAAMPALAAHEERRVRHSLLKSWKEVLEAQSGATATMGVSAGHSSLGNLEAARDESQNALQYRMYMNAGHILHYSAVKNAGHSVHHRQMEAWIASLRHALAKNDGQTVNDTLERLYGRALQGVVHLNYLQNLSTILWGVLTEEQMLRHFNGAAPPLERTGFEAICAKNSAEAMRDAFADRFAFLMEKGCRQSEEQYSQRVRHIIRHVQDNLGKDIGLVSIAEEFQLHKTHLARVFKEEMHCGLGEYIRRQRIEKAKELLKNSQNRVNEIVYQVGFNNPQNFYSLFMRHVGLTPKEYRGKYG